MAVRCIGLSVHQQVQLPQRAQRLALPMRPLTARNTIEGRKKRAGASRLPPTVNWCRKAFLGANFVCFPLSPTAVCPTGAGQGERMDSLKNFIKGLTETPQSEPIPGSTQMPNSAGGYAWAVDDWTRLMRFLILGSEGGTYYISERKLTQENAEAVARCIAEDGARTVRTIVEVSEAGRAPKNDPAIFALALCATLGDAETKRAAFEAVPRVCRTGTHLFHFAQFVDGLRGWGRGLREAVAAWYAMPPRKLALQAIKYQA